MICQYCVKALDPNFPATCYFDKWFHTTQDEDGNPVSVSLSCWGKSDFGLQSLVNLAPITTIEGRPSPYG
jgi:hypothetical protein